MASALEPPWALMTGLEMPMNAVPPTLLGSSRALNSFSPGITSSAASFVSRFLLNILFSALPANEPTPSMDLSITLPEKPSVTMTSQPPLMASLASMLPMKCRSPASSALRSRARVAFCSSVPLLSSAPMFRRPTRGVSTPNTRLA